MAWASTNLSVDSERKLQRLYWLLWCVIWLLACHPRTANVRISCWEEKHSGACLSNVFPWSQLDRPLWFIVWARHCRRHCNSVPPLLLYIYMTLKCSKPVSNCKTCEMWETLLLFKVHLKIKYNVKIVLLIFFCFKSILNLHCQIKGEQHKQSINALLEFRQKN